MARTWKNPFMVLLVFAFSITLVLFHYLIVNFILAFQLTYYFFMEGATGDKIYAQKYERAFKNMLSNKKGKKGEGD